MPLARSNLPVLPRELKATSSEQVASLWSNYGYIYRLHLSSEPHTLIFKSIHPPAVAHPDESHLRRLLSYDVERWFYRHLTSRLPETVKVAKDYPLQSDAEHSLLLEDLSIEFPYPASGSLDRDATTCVLHWLSGFHGTFFRTHSREGAVRLPLVPPPMQWKSGESAGVWERGTYWYLDTRREELEQTNEDDYSWLMPWVEKVRLVNDAVNHEVEAYGTLMHGDVKGANIVFNRDPYPRRGGKASSSATELALCCALYDFQYVGLGLSTLDLVYFLGTSVEPKLLRSLADEREILQEYFDRFQEVAAREPADGSEYTFDKFWAHWELSIVDWCRFMAGWGFWGNDRWVERRAKGIVESWDTSDFPFLGPQALGS
ncbi:uncharacterized protein PHACADRAFT_142873 [Phanerochaete carnosa HHB-10118-sp]|uniref:Aminoglycoside phosphotransferase domain-containing protein n=1 Tax=Phanerochaete carnosa (strain HHB-10118-sp) TaxID=650164 RepID=K5W783_PHACS|nr:uncharacterized protein PHACADRAFT_142873 [Phanerochaete carnosa HHB-10118-sp]EKM55030.1 hypothetical protein PHACADRAFT_142873 [Phanerochaete carnosa HHB-10118-sp]